MAESADLQAELREALTTIDSLLEGESMFSDRDAYWANGTEVVHFESDGAVEVRLTKGVISARRAALKADSRVELRRSGADWLTVHMAEIADVAFVVDLVRRRAGPPAGRWLVAEARANGRRAGATEALPLTAVNTR